jgi:hypothetical protein
MVISVIAWALLLAWLAAVLGQESSEPTAVPVRECEAGG